MGIMECFLIILVLIVVIRAINERFIHMQGDIALVLFSSVISVGLLVAKNLAGECAFTDFVNEIGNFGFSEYLLDGVLCFMLFAGAGKVNFRKFKSNIKTISLLALITTVISSALYGLIFWAAGFVFGIKLDIWLCILLGCIVSPTDPIAATGILNKLGLSKNVTSVIESESLFNDGTGVALFLFVKSIVSRSGEENFLLVMLKEVFGALGVALVVSFLLFKLITLTKSPVTRIIISLLDVSLSYFVCEKFGFSGIIASVVCGMYFSYMTAKKSDSIIITDTEGVYRSFVPTELPSHECAFAMTIHKSQGSGYDNVLMVLPDRFVPVLTRELVYTGMTRTKRNLTILAPEPLLREAIDRPTLRWSGLQDELCPHKAQKLGK